MDRTGRGTHLERWKIDTPKSREGMAPGIPVKIIPLLTKREARRRRWKLECLKPGVCKIHGLKLEPQEEEGCQRNNQRWACEACWEEALAYTAILKLATEEDEILRLQR